MANTSIYAAFERMWQHIIAKLGTKADMYHNHDDMYYTETEIDAMIEDVSAVIPSATVDDNGKFLRVVDGAAAWTTIPDAREGSF
mgnify:CR=1 FL=1